MDVALPPVSGLAALRLFEVATRYQYWIGSLFPYAHVHTVGRPSNKGISKRKNAMPATKATAQRPPLPPFTRDTAIQKVRLAEDAWNSRDPGKVALAYPVGSRWRNRSEFVKGRQGVGPFTALNW